MEWFLRGLLVVVYWSNISGIKVTTAPRATIFLFAYLASRYRNSPTIDAYSGAMEFVLIDCVYGFRWWFQVPWNSFTMYLIEWALGSLSQLICLREQRDAVHITCLANRFWSWCSRCAWRLVVSLIHGLAAAIETCAVMAIIPDVQVLLFMRVDGRTPIRPWGACGLGYSCCFGQKQLRRTVRGEIIAELIVCDLAVEWDDNIDDIHVMDLPWRMFIVWSCVPRCGNSTLIIWERGWTNWPENVKRRKSCEGAEQLCFNAYEFDTRIKMILSVVMCVCLWPPVRDGVP